MDSLVIILVPVCGDSRDHPVAIAARYTSLMHSVAASHAKDRHCDTGTKQTKPRQRNGTGEEAHGKQADFAADRKEGGLDLTVGYQKAPFPYFST